MRRWNKILVASVASGAILTGVGAGAAQAAPRPQQSSVSQQQSSVSVTRAVVAPAPLSVGVNRTVTAPSPGSANTPAAEAGVPLAVRLAVKAAMAVIKKRSVSTYNAIIGYVLQGRAKFIYAWNKYIPGWAKNLVGGLSASAIYDAIRWIIGI